MTAMNIQTLEKLVRQTIKGEEVAEKSNSMLSSREITPAEHKSLQIVSFKVAGNTSASAGTVAFAQPCLMWF